MRRLKKGGVSVLFSFGSLVAGLVSAMLIFLWANDELSIDRYNKNYSNIFLVHGYLEGDTPTEFFGCPPAVGPAIANEEPTMVEYATRYLHNTQTFRYGDKTEALDVCGCESDYFNIFTVKLISGHFPEGQSEAIVSELASKRLFGDEPAIGKVVSMEGKEDFTIVGLFEDLPRSNYYSARANVFVRLEVLCKLFGMRSDTWWNNSFGTAVLLHNPADADVLNQRWQHRINKECGDNTMLKLRHLTAHRMEWLKPAVGCFSLIALLILLASVLSYVNLNMARAVNQAKELAVRKAYGGNRLDLMKVIFSDITVTCLVAFWFAILLTIAVLPAFDALLEKQVSVSEMFRPLPLLFYFMLFIVTVLLSGAYPALALTGNGAMGNIAGNRKHKRGIFRNAFIFTMYVSSITIFILLGVFTSQIRHMRNMDTGMDTEQTLWVGVGENIINRLDAFKNDLQKSPDVLSTAFVNQLPSCIGNNSDGFDWEGKAPDFKPLITYYFTDKDVFDTYQLELIEGEKPQSDNFGTYINKTLADKIGWDFFAGRELWIDGNAVTINGVFKDLLFNSLNEPNYPMVIVPKADWVNWGYVVVRFAGKSHQNVVKLAQETFNAYTPGELFYYGFMDDQYEQMIATEKRLQKLIFLFGVLAILILCFGSLGVIMFTAEQKVKETGIRKYLGESVPSLMARFAKPYILHGLAGAVVSGFLAKWVADIFLANYADHISVTALHYILPALFIIMFTVATILWQSYKASTRNPIEAIKTE